MLRRHRTILLPPDRSPSGSAGAAEPGADMTSATEKGADMRSDDDRSRQRLPPARPLLLLLGVTLIVIVGVVIGGVALVAFLGNQGDDADWSRWSDIGEAFGVVNSVVSAFAVAALVITWTLQMRDRREQQAELVLQRRIVEGAETALRRSADVDVRKLHVNLIRMAVDHPHLADVWPSHSEVDPRIQTQHMYANLLIQHVWLGFTAGIVTREEMIANLRYLFASPRVRAFWRDTADSRRNIYVENTTEVTLAAIAEDIWREYEELLACSADDGIRPAAGSGRRLAEAHRQGESPRRTD
jgi:hypothetical protein